MADEAKQHSLGHKKWIMEFMKTRPDLKCSYDDLVQEGEKHHCDTLGAMLKLLKKEKVLGYKQMFLMRATASGRGARRRDARRRTRRDATRRGRYPMHKDEEVTLLNPDYVPS